MRVQAFYHADSDLQALVYSSLENDKAIDVKSIDLAGKTDIADKMIIASGLSNRHVGAIAEHLSHRLKLSGFNNFSIEGLQECNWVIIDTGDIVVHIFRPETRNYYNLEKMWEAPASIPA